LTMALPFVEEVVEVIVGQDAVKFLTLGILCSRIGSLPHGLVHVFRTHLVACRVGTHWRLLVASGREDGNVSLVDTVVRHAQAVGSHLITHVVRRHPSTLNPWRVVTASNAVFRFGALCHS